MEATVHIITIYAKQINQKQLGITYLARISDEKHPSEISQPEHFVHETVRYVYQLIRGRNKTCFPRFKLEKTRYFI